MHGVWHVSSEPIDKCSLLLMLRDAFRVETPIIPCRDVRIDRTLDSSRFRHAAGYRPPSWEAMVREMALDSAPTLMEASIDTHR
jgi:dTDP-4-dehydrorhamnose reductase